MQIRQVTTKDNLVSIAAQCNSSTWGEDSELLTYSESSLADYIASDRNILVAAFDEDRVAGIAIGYVLLHPSGNKTLYIDELDTHPDYRRQGVATKIMEKFFAVGRLQDCSEVWLSSSKTNHIAHTFYAKLEPTEQKDATIFGYVL